MEQFIFEKRSPNGIFWRACNNLLRRKTTLKWKYVVRLVSGTIRRVENDPHVTLLGYVVPLKQFLYEKRSSSGIFYVAP